MGLMVASDSTGELVLVFGAVFLTTYLLYRRYNASDNGHKLAPSLPSLPIVGSLPFLPTKMENLAEFCISPRNKLGKIFSFRAGSRYVLVISGRKVIHEALVTKSVDFADKPWFYFDTLTNPRRKGIFTVPYSSALKSHHQLCLSILKKFGFGQRVMETRILMEVEEMISRVREEQGRPFDVRHLITSCVANVIVNMAFGRRFDHSHPTYQRFLADVNKAFANFVFELEIFPLLRHIPHYKKQMSLILSLMERMSEVIETNVVACQEDETMPESFVNYFIEAQGPDYDREQLLYTIRDLVIAGTETTSTTIRWAILLLTNHVSVQERLQSEIDSVIGRDRLPALDDRLKMPYVEATILELMRHKTLVPFILHNTLQDTELDGYSLPADAMVMLNLHSAHMDPADWHQPQLFRPERFLDQSGNVVGRDRIIPFGLGKRSCLGEQLARQEIFLFLVALLQNFYFKPPEGEEQIEVHEVWGETVSPSAYKVRLVDREQP